MTCVLKCCSDWRRHCGRRGCVPSGGAAAALVRAAAEAGPRQAAGTCRNGRQGRRGVGLGHRQQQRRRHRVHGPVVAPPRPEEPWRQRPRRRVAHSQQGCVPDLALSVATVGCALRWSVSKFTCHLLVRPILSILGCQIPSREALSSVHSCQCFRYSPPAGAPAVHAEHAHPFCLLSCFRSRCAVRSLPGTRKLESAL